MICDISNLGSIGVAAIGAVFYLNYDSLLDFLIKDAPLCPILLSPFCVRVALFLLCFPVLVFSDFIFPHVAEFEDGDASGLSYLWSLDYMVFLYMTNSAICNSRKSFLANSF